MLPHPANLSPVLLISYCCSSAGRLLCSLSLAFSCSQREEKAGGRLDSALNSLDLMLSNYLLLFLASLSFSCFTCVCFFLSPCFCFVFFLLVLYLSFLQFHNVAFLIPRCVSSFFLLCVCLSSLTLPFLLVLFYLSRFLFLNAFLMLRFVFPAAFLLSISCVCFSLFCSFLRLFSPFSSCSVIFFSNLP